MTKKPKGAATKIHFRSRFQKSITHGLGSVGWNAGAMGTRPRWVSRMLPPMYEKPTQKTVQN